MDLGDDVDTVDVSFGVTDVSALARQTNARHRITRKISHTIINPDWEYILEGASAKTNNLALVKLDRPVVFSNYIQPVCLANRRNETEEYRNCKVAGWGDSDEESFYFGK